MKTHSILIFFLTLLMGFAPSGIFCQGAEAPALSAQTKGNTTKKPASAQKKSRPQNTGTKTANTSKPSSKAPRTAAQVKKDREKNTAALRETRNKIKLNTQQTEQRLNQLNLLEGEIANCNVNINRLNTTLDSINGAITEAVDSINALDNRLNGITSLYVSAVRKSQSARQHKGRLAFIFSSNSFSQAYRRMRALKQFGKWRDRRSKEISELRAEIDKRKLALDALHTHASSALGQLNGQKSTLEKKQAETSQLVSRLKTEGSELNAIMQRRQREARALDDELDRIIAEEAARQERLRREQAEAKRKAEEEAARIAREKEEAERAEAERLAAIEAEKARVAAQEAQKAKEAERAAQARAAEAERKARETADKEARKLAEKKAKEEREAAKRAEQERVKAEREAAKKKAEAEKQLAQAKARQGKPVKHKGKSNSETKTDSEASAPRLAHSAPAASASTGVASAAIDTNLGSDFENAKGKLPYPVSGRYTIVKPFGRQKHPTLPHVETNNSGIDMQTEPGAAVRCVFDGEVSAVFRPDGYNTVVVIRHGKYMTVYANLGAISVSNGQKVKAGQSIGTVYTDTADSNRSVLHFEIRNQRLKENPEAWLRR